MKFEIKAKRDSNACGWEAKLSGREISACPHEVDSLFSGLRFETRCTFEISNVRPRYYDYHEFEWSWASGAYYGRSIKGPGIEPRITSHTSAAIKKKFENKGEFFCTIFVSIY